MEGEFESLPLLPHLEYQILLDLLVEHPAEVSKCMYDIVYYMNLFVKIVSLCDCLGTCMLHAHICICLSACMCS